MSNAITPRANNDSRAGAAQQLAYHWLQNARDEVAADDSEAYALEHCAKALLSVFHPDVDLISSAARQTYIESGVWPTRTEIAEHSTESPFEVVGTATYDETRDLLVSPAGHADVVAALAEEADDDDDEGTVSESLEATVERRLPHARTLFEGV